MGATQGPYRIVDQNIVGQNAQGLMFTYPYQVEGNVLVLNMPDMGGLVQFQRSRKGDLRVVRRCILVLRTAIALPVWQGGFPCFCERYDMRNC